VQLERSWITAVIDTYSKTFCPSFTLFHGD
jgi:hypothetical protein